VAGDDRIELKIDAAGAQKLVDRVQPALAASAQQRVDALVQSWEAETNADPDLGGDRRDATVRHVQLAIAKFGSPELRKLLGPTKRGGTALGSHPAIVRFIAAIGRRLDEENGDLRR
jgi:hypothetical protein